MINPLRRWRAITGALLMVSMLAACGGSATAPKAGTAPAAPTDPAKAQPAAPAAPAPAAAPKEMRKLLVAVPAQSLTFMPNLIARDKGFLKEEGLDVTYEIMKTDVSLAALRKGDAQFTLSASTSIRSAATGFPVKFVMATVDYPLWTLYVTPDVPDIAGLKGKPLAGLAPQSAETVVFRELLGQKGLNVETEVNILSLNTWPNVFAALKGGTAKGAVLAPPFDLRAREAGWKALAGPTDLPPTVAGGVAVSTDFLAKEPETVKAFLRATLRGLHWIIDPKNNDAALEYMQKQFELSADDAAKLLDPFRASLSKDGTVAEAKIVAELRRANASVKPADVADFTLVKTLKH